MNTKKLYELGAKTGLSAGEVDRLAGAGGRLTGYGRQAARYGLLGLLAVGLASVAGCFRAQKVPAPAPQAKPQTLQDLAASVLESTAAAKAPEGDGSCGPYPGYPCGTRYYTVSPGDFRGKALS